MNASESVDPACRLASSQVPYQMWGSFEKQLTLMSQIRSAISICARLLGKAAGISDAYLQLMDCSIIEYRTDPKAIVMLTYTRWKNLGRRHFRGAYGNAA